MSTKEKLNKFIDSLNYNGQTKYMNGFDENVSNVYLPALKPWETCAYRFEKRDPAKIRLHTIPDDNDKTSFMPGMFFLADENLFTNVPTPLAFYEYERESIRLRASLPGVAMETIDNPSAGALKLAADRMAEECKKRSVQTEMKFYKQYFKTSEGFDVSCKYNDVAGFGLNTGSANDQVCVITLRQNIFQIALDKTYKKPSDFFTERVHLDDIERFCSSSRPPAYVNRVAYGRKIYISFSTSDHSYDLSASITVKGAEVKFDNKKQLEKCKITAVTVGGGSNSYSKIVSLEDVEKMIEDFVKSGGDDAISHAVPIEWETMYLKDNALIYTDTKPLYIKRVENITIKIIGNTSGTLFNSRLRYMRPRYGQQNVIEWGIEQKSHDYKAGDTRPVICPARSCCFELNVDKHGDINGAYDYNILVPSLPLATMEYDDRGELFFKITVRGMLGNKAYSLEPSVYSDVYKKANSIIHSIFPESESKEFKNLPDKDLVVLFKARMMWYITGQFPTTEIKDKYYNFKVNQNSSSVLNVNLRWMEPVEGSGGKKWIRRYEKHWMKNETVWKSKSQRLPVGACCFEVNIDKHGDIGGSYDYCGAIPYIDLGRLPRNSGGTPEFNFNIEGTATKSGKKFSCNPSHTECYINTSNKARLERIFTREIYDGYTQEQIIKIYKEGILREGYKKK